MNIEKELQLLFQDKGRMEKYQSAVRTLQEIGVERILRRVAEPQPMDLSNPRHMEVSASLQIHSAGYFDALNGVFDLPSLFEGAVSDSAMADFGAEETMKNMGYVDERE